MKPLKFLAALILLVPAALPAQLWSSWSQPSGCVGPVSGSMGSTTVTYTGTYNGVVDAALTTCSVNPFWPAPFSDINYFTTNGTTAYGSYTPTNGSFIQLVDMVQLNEAQTAYVPISTNTITFADAVINPWIALISVGNDKVGGEAIAVTYTFDSPFEIVTYNAVGGVPPYWGNSMTVQTLGVPQTSLVGREFSGVLQFTGTFTSLSFTVDNNERWSGFTVGALATVAPEPSTYALMAVGLVATGLVARRRRG